MDYTKRLNLIHILFFVYLVVFPLGQLAKVDLNMGNLNIPIFAVDAFSIAIFLVTLSRRLNIKNDKYFEWFFAAATFSSLYSIFIFKSEAIPGLLYLIRLLGFYGLYAGTVSLIQNKVLKKKVVVNSLVLVSLSAAVLGWLQYFFIPDFRAFAVWGWDDHLYRLVGTFLDPGFTSIILVFGFLASISILQSFKERPLKVVIMGFLFITILFTYSRAGYFALIVGSAYLLKKSPFVLAFMIVLLVVGMLLLPRPRGEGVKLGRTASVEARITNYKETIDLISKSPVVGFGFNNICLVRNMKRDISSFNHACSGADSSLLFILATTGVVGGLIFLGMLYQMIFLSAGNTYGLIFRSSAFALLAHSLFVGSIFYTWVAGWIMIVYALSVTD